MKKTAAAAIILSAMTFSAVSHADRNTVTLGYAQSKVQDFKDIKGANLKYRYEWDSSFGIISSFTYMSGKESESYLLTKDIIENKVDLKYYSLSAGPTYRFNDYISVYGLLGVNYNKVKSSSIWKNWEGDRGHVIAGEAHGNEKKASLMYGLGLQINPVDYLAIDIGYEGSRVSSNNSTHSINGFNIGLGYSF